MIRTLDISTHHQAEFFYSRWAMLYGLVFALIWTGFVAGAAWLFYQEGVGGFFASAFGMFFFGVFALITVFGVIPMGVKSLSYLLHNRPALVVSSEGVEFRFKKKKFAWNDVEKITLKRKAGKHHSAILIHLRDQKKPAKLQMFGMWRHKDLVLKALHTYAGGSVLIEENPAARGN